MMYSLYLNIIGYTGWGVVTFLSEILATKRLLIVEHWFMACAKKRYLRFFVMTYSVSTMQWTKQK